MITLGVILIIIGLLVHPLAFLWIIGVIVLIIGVVLFALGSMGRAVGGRKHYY
jgi:Flp pilus assembly protein protease CpaA